MGEGAIPIKEVAENVIKNLSKERTSKEEKVKKVWQKAVGRRFYSHTQPVSFRKHRLVVNVDSSAWLYELTMKKKIIASRLKKMLRDDFEELQFRIGKIEE